MIPLAGGERCQAAERRCDAVMISAQRLLQNEEGSFKKRFSLGLSMGRALGVELAQTVQGQANVSVGRTQGFLSDREGALIQPFRLGEIALAPVNQGEVVECRRNRRVIGTDALLGDRQVTQEKLLGLRVITFLAIEHRQVVECRRNLRMLRAERLLSDGQCPLVERFRRSVISSKVMNLREAIQR